MEDEIRQIHQFWFGEIAGDWCAEDRNSLWWYESEAIDAEIQARFGVAHRRAVSGDLNHWGETPGGRLALILLLDQFSRNLYRRQADAFSADERALQTCQEGCRREQDVQLRLIERVFFYMPFMHSESMAHQDEVLRLNQALLDAADQADKAKAERYVKAAVLHRDLIGRFGRFPHRNAVLGRASTDAETAYLAGDHESFGQS